MQQNSILSYVSERVRVTIDVIEHALKVFRKAKDVQ